MVDTRGGGPLRSKAGTEVNMAQTQREGVNQYPKSATTVDRLGEQAHFHATGEDFLDCLASRSHEPDAVPPDIVQRELDALRADLS